MTTHRTKGRPYAEAFDFEDWFKDTVKETCGVFEEAAEKINQAEFWQHVRNMQREQLLAVRSVIDGMIDHLDKQERKSA